LKAANRARLAAFLRLACTAFVAFVALADSSAMINKFLIA
jgi:hypothetical protein